MTTPPPPSSSHIVVDLAGFGLHCLPGGLADIKHLLQVFQDNFPEILYRVIIVNAPWIFYGTWNVIKTFLNDRIRSKIKVGTALSVGGGRVRIGGVCTYVHACI